MVLISPFEKVDEDITGAVCIDTELNDFGTDEHGYTDTY